MTKNVSIWQRGQIRLTTEASTQQQLKRLQRHQQRTVQSVAQTVNLEPNYQQTMQKPFRGKDGKVIIPNRKHINQAWKMFFERHRKNHLFQEARLFFYASTDSPLSLAKTLWSGNGRSCIVLN